MAIRKGLLWLLLLVLLSGCGPGGDDQGTGTADVTISYRREGGVAGLSQEWVIHLDGRVDGPGEMEMRVPPAVVEDILEQSAEIEPSGGTPEPAPCCDRFTYTITINIDDRQTTFTLNEGAVLAAAESEMFAAVESLINTAEPLP
jgi:hypothetical protein